MTRDESQAGQTWTQDEIDLVVADYFDMRAKFLRGEHFVKARHYERIIESTGRTKPSVERKYMNISATLERLCLPWLKGYAPLRNFQNALLHSVERFVGQEWNGEIIPATSSREFHDEMEIFVEAAPERVNRLCPKTQSWSGSHESSIPRFAMNATEKLAMPVSKE